jgi:glycosyltransferase involved in cell wall biosynthesis
MKKVSVALAVYKGGDFLIEQIKSILASTLLPNEIVIIDDCPEEPSKKHIDEFKFEELGVVLKYLKNEQNLGPSLSFAKAVAYSSGDIVFFCDQDDFWLEIKIETILKYFDDPTCLLVYSDGVITDENLTPTEKTIFNTRKRAKLELGQNREVKEFFSNPDIKGCMMAFDGKFARSVFGNAPENFDDYWGHDHWLAIQAFIKGGIHVYSDVLFFHRFHSSNTSSAVKFSIFNFQLIKKYYKRARLEKIDHYYQKYSLIFKLLNSDKHIDLHESVNYFLIYEKKRIGFLKMTIFIRWIFLLSLLSFYSKYRNGVYSFLRDWLIAPKGE